MFWFFRGFEFGGFQLSMALVDGLRGGASAAALAIHDTGEKSLLVLSWIL